MLLHSVLCTRLPLMIRMINLPGCISIMFCRFRRPFWPGESSGAVSSNTPKTSHTSVRLSFAKQRKRISGLCL